MRVKATSGTGLPDFLRDGEVVLTFDDGPWSGNTPAVLTQQLEKELGGQTANLRAISSVVRTIEASNFNDRFSAIR